MHRLFLVLFLAVLPLLGTDTPGARATEIPRFEIECAGFDGPIASDHTCDSLELSPAITWKNVPAGTVSYTVILDAPDHPGGTFRHWGVYNIAVDATGLPEGTRGDGAFARNDYGNSTYSGPCPPRGAGPLRYRLKVYAVERMLTFPSTPSVSKLERIARAHAVAYAEIVGTFER